MYCCRSATVVVAEGTVTKLSGGASGKAPSTAARDVLDRTRAPLTTTDPQTLGGYTDQLKAWCARHQVPFLGVAVIALTAPDPSDLQTRGAVRGMRDRCKCDAIRYSL